VQTTFGILDRFLYCDRNAWDEGECIAESVNRTPMLSAWRYCIQTQFCRPSMNFFL